MTQPENDFCLTSNSPGETIQFGTLIGHALCGGEVLGLTGCLGAGKTQLVKGIAVGNGLRDHRAVTSPTFTLVQEYFGRLTLFHVDAYRISDAREVPPLGLEEMIRDDAVLLIEWADRIRSVLPDDLFWLHIEPIGESAREIHCQANGISSRQLLSTLCSNIDSATRAP